jgi:hypothetical protein
VYFLYFYCQIWKNMVQTKNPALAPHPLQPVGKQEGSGKNHTSDILSIKDSKVKTQNDVVGSI